MTQHTDGNLHEAFLDSDRPHILMITNHGIHQWNVVPGLPDTGGQNVFVNQFTDTLADLGFRITIINRGGYPHPTTDEMHEGLDYKNAHERILYIEDDTKAFVRKEDMHEQIPQLVDFLHDFLADEDMPIDFVISHYWDAAKIGVELNERLPEKVKHVWVPHSLGAVKKQNMSPDTWEGLRINERIAVEREIVPELDGVAATSSRIRRSLLEDYDHESTLFLPPCVKSERFYPRDIPADHSIWAFLHEMTGLPIAEIQESKIITEISRTDTTKRKDVLIKAFAQVHEQIPNSILVVAIDDTEEELSAELKGLIRQHGLESHVAAVGNIWKILPDMYGVTDVYCSPSVMEGFGMAVQEAAATKVPVVSSNLIPFVKEYLLSENVKEVAAEDAVAPLQQGAGAIIVQADDVPGFAHALEMLLADDSLRRRMGEQAYDITIPYFTWRGMTERFLEASDVDLP